jgi:hypothetical protein
MRKHSLRDPRIQERARQHEALMRRIRLLPEGPAKTAELALYAALINERSRQTVAYTRAVLADEPILLAQFNAIVEAMEAEIANLDEKLARARKAAGDEPTKPN